MVHFSLTLLDKCTGAVNSVMRFTVSNQQTSLQVTQSESANSIDGEASSQMLSTMERNLVALCLSQECKVSYKIRKFYSLLHTCMQLQK